MKLERQSVMTGLLTGVLVVCITPTVQAQVTITNVQINTTDQGLEIILETPEGQQPEVFSGSIGTTFFADIANAQLNLASGQDFRQDNPASGIASISVSQQPNNLVQITVIGIETTPIVQINRISGRLVLTVTPEQPSETEETPDSETSNQQEDEAIELVVTDDTQDNSYFVPNSSTATGTDTPLRDTPFSIQVVPNRVLRDQQVIRLDDALRNVSGVQQNSADPRGQRFQIRGFDSSSVLRDGFRQTFGRSGNSGFQELSNVQQVEVLKGPASILYGALEPGGVINIVTKQPLADPFQQIEFQAGNRGLLNPSIDFTGPVSRDKSLLYRLNFAYRNERSFRDFDTYIERKFIAPTFTWNIDEQTKLTFEVEYSDDDRPADFGVLALGDQVVDTPNARNFGEPGDYLRAETLRVGYRFQHDFNENWQFQNAFNYLRYDSTFSSAFTFSVDEETLTAFRSFIYLDQPSTNYELKSKVIGNFDTWSIKHKILFDVGLTRREQLGNIGRSDFSDIPLNIFAPVYGTVPRPDPNTQEIFTFSDYQVDQLRITFQDQITLFDNLKLVAAFNYDSVEQKFWDRLTDENTVQYDDSVVPRVGLVYQPIEEVSLYGSYSQSFYPGAGQTVSGQFLDPEESEQYEIGIRAEILDKKLSFNLAYFDITKNNVATSDPEFPIFSVAVGEQRSRGVELDIVGEIIPGLNIVFNYANITAEITEDNDIPVGNRLFNVPENSANLWLTYQIQDGFFEGLGFGGGFNYVDERFGDNANSFRLESYTLANAAVFYERDNWKFALNIRNIFDEDHIKGSENSRNNEIYPGEPFTLLGSISVKF
ncbi:TonB-dependent siderophore receptor [Rippkaea orientalis PCC 8801]|uniref:TonB-dependent siderophore receptor n=1 Tax=Rippkaea orientalis (strain PCC 8801 / RF-1) TaxID=41431 RepID=B7JWH8_RIPO1|nr:TonB-dependent siderophore receptor [Rippkaea orientalis]ACK67023.1 TonB-dependent siderophore receptor [Rippkaea orientalis PCC 8801]